MLKNILTYNLINKLECIIITYYINEINALK